MAMATPVSREGIPADGMHRTLTRQHWLLIIFCTLVSLMDGFDTQAISFAAPSLLRELGISSSILGTVFSAGLLGGMCGALPAAHIERRIGRRSLLLLCLLWFSLGAILTTFATGGLQLIAVRFFSGVGLGMAIPMVLGAMTDSIPRGVRARALAIVMCAIPAGGLFVGFVAAAVIPRFGWQSLFYIGCLLPLALVPLLHVVFPSNRVVPISDEGRPSDEAVSAEKRGYFRSLFAEGGIGLVILLITNFFGAGLIFVLLSWTPALLIDMGTGQRGASVAGAILNGGAMLAFLALGYLLDRREPVSLTVVCYVLATAFISCLGFSSGNGPWVLTFAFLVGFFGVGIQVAITYLIANTVSPHRRVAVLGVGMISSRSGGAIGPIVIGVLAQSGLTPTGLFLFMATIAAVTGGGTLAYGWSERARQGSR